MHRVKQRRIVAVLKAVELLGRNDACLHDAWWDSLSLGTITTHTHAAATDTMVAAAQNHHFIPMRPVQTVEAQQDKHRGRDAHSSVSRSKAHSSAGGSGQAEASSQSY